VSFGGEWVKLPSKIEQATDFVPNSVVNLRGKVSLSRERILAIEERVADGQPGSCTPARRAVCAPGSGARFRIPPEIAIWALKISFIHSNGEGGIRTPERGQPPLRDFQSRPFNRSGTSPGRRLAYRGHAPRRSLRIQRHP
jgi:hypothetical protein